MARKPSQPVSEESTQNQTANQAATQTAPESSTKSRQKSRVATPDVSSATAEVAAPQKSSSKSASKRGAQSENSHTTPVQPTPPVVSDTSDTQSHRTPPTRDSVMSSFDALVAEISAEIDRQKSLDSKVKSAKFLRNLNRKLLLLKNQSSRVMKQRPRATRKKNTSNSGFMKPVPVTKEMAQFAGWDPKEPHSRVDVTKCLCKYIRDHELQNPEDRRKIRPDAKLRKLLTIDATDKEDLTYYRLQSKLSNCFPR